jgi:3-dehydroquinate synthase
MVIPRGEKAKSRQTLEGLYDFLLGEKITRDDFLLACGGGVTSDLVGFAAATTLRGVRWGVISTTLLGMVDAAIGGKTGINHARGKNLVGAFWPPEFVISDLEFLSTLPERELVCGLGEVLKTAGLAGRAVVSRLTDYLNNDRRLDFSALPGLVIDCAGYKAAVVSRDEQEKGRRMVLNFGHTFAHGIERAVGYGRLRHGEAVILGVNTALALGRRIGYNSRGLVEYGHLTSAMTALVPKRRIDVAEVLSAMALDKKRSGADQKYVLLTQLGRPKICTGLKAEEVRAALTQTLKSYWSQGYERG